MSKQINNAVTLNGSADRNSLVSHWAAGWAEEHNAPEKESRIMATHRGRGLDDRGALVMDCGYITLGAREIILPLIMASPIGVKTKVN